jgi:hypothetical protein
MIGDGETRRKGEGVSDLPFIRIVDHGHQHIDDLLIPILNCGVFGQSTNIFQHKEIPWIFRKFPAQR